MFGYETTLNSISTMGADTRPAAEKERKKKRLLRVNVRKKIFFYVITVGVL